MISSNQLPDPNLDVLLVGAGFSGVYLLQKLRKLNFSVKVFEAGSDLGGVWHWNCYPGARVDSDYYIYQFSIPELWKDWTFTERFPGRDEILKYFKHVDEKLEVKKDVVFNTRVKGAKFDKDANRWEVQTDNGVTARPQHLILCTGFAAKPLFPGVPGLDTFKGIIHHTSLWPQQGVDLEGKRIAVIGTGASGVQVIQELGPKAKALTVFQRTPNLTVPMAQHAVSKETQERQKAKLWPAIFKRRLETFGGYHYDLLSTTLISDLSASPEKVHVFLEDLWAKGGLSYWVASYPDIFMDEKANQVVYDFWRDKVRERLTSEEMKELLAPEKPPHPFGVKRPSLEQAYYEVFNLPHVSLIDISTNSISAITPNGIRTADGKEHELDAIIFATGFDAVTGSMARIDIESADESGEKVGEKWGKGLRTYLGMTTVGYPNMFFLYGPQGPTAFSNGPTCAEVQGDWIASVLTHMRDNKHASIEPRPEQEETFTKFVNDVFSMGLWMNVKSWYNGGNVPGKKIESMNFAAGMPKYRSFLSDEAGSGYQGFVFAS